MKKKRKSKAAIAAAVCAAVLTGVSCAVIVGTTAKLRSLDHLEMPDLSGMRDGMYTGEYSLAPVYARIRMTVSDGKISDLALLEHRCGRGQPAESVLEDVLRTQSLDVDAVAGATVSSKCILAAVRDAAAKPEREDPN